MGGGGAHTLVGGHSDFGGVPPSPSGVFTGFFGCPDPPPHGNNITWKFDVGLH